MVTTRRDFFKNILEGVKENIALPGFFESFNNTRKSHITKNKNEGIYVEPFITGHISDFQPGTFTFVCDKKYVIISKPEGIFSVKAEVFHNGKTEPRLMLELNNEGLIILKPGEIYSEKNLLSIMTGEFIQEEENF